MSYYNPHYVRIPFSPNIWTWIHSPFKISCSIVELVQDTFLWLSSVMRLTTHRILDHPLV